MRSYTLLVKGELLFLASSIFQAQIYMREFITSVNPNIEWEESA